MIVADTNLVAYLLISGEFTEAVEGVYAVDSEWIAPSSWRIEFLNVLTRYCRKKILTPVKAIEAYRRAETIITPPPMEASAEDIINLSDSSGASGYDCNFVILARMNRLPLVTFDKGILTRFPDIAVRPNQLENWWKKRKE